MKEYGLSDEELKALGEKTVASGKIYCWVESQSLSKNRKKCGMEILIS